jgi:hypothetical protein
VIAPRASASAAVTAPATMTMSTPRQAARADGPLRRATATTTTAASAPNTTAGAAARTEDTAVIQIGRPSALATAATARPPRTVPTTAPTATGTPPAMPASTTMWRVRAPRRRTNCAVATWSRRSPIAPIAQNPSSSAVAAPPSNANRRVDRLARSASARSCWSGDVRLSRDRNSTMLASALLLR